MADSTAPSLRITSPTGNVVVPSSSVTVQWTTSDASGVVYNPMRPNSGDGIRVNGSNYTFTELVNGMYGIKV
jgi:hypothetical protein